MWTSILSLLGKGVELFLALFRKKEEIRKRAEEDINSEEMVTNRVRKEEEKQQDAVDQKIEDAANGDKKALDDLRRLAGE